MAVRQLSQHQASPDTHALRHSGRQFLTQIVFSPLDLSLLLLLLSSPPPVCISSLLFLSLSLSLHYLGPLSGPLLSLLFFYRDPACAPLTLCGCGLGLSPVIPRLSIYFNESSSERLLFDSFEAFPLSCFSLQIPRPPSSCLGNSPRVCAAPPLSGRGSPICLAIRCSCLPAIELRETHLAPLTQTFTRSSSTSTIKGGDPVEEAPTPVAPQPPNSSTNADGISMCSVIP